MNPFSQLSRRAKLIEVLRWLGVLPAALLGELVVRHGIGVAFAAVHMVSYGARENVSGLNAGHFLRIVFYYVVPRSAFVIAGAKIAPRFQLATAIALTGLGVFLSLMTHVVVQHVAGNRVGVTNYAHFIAESAGLAVGATGILWSERWCRRSRGAEGKGSRIEERR
jgi:hypothetical protein